LSEELIDELSKSREEYRVSTQKAQEAGKTVYDRGNAQVQLVLGQCILFPPLVACYIWFVDRRFEIWDSLALVALLFGTSTLVALFTERKPRAEIARLLGLSNIKRDRYEELLMELENERDKLDQ